MDISQIRYFLAIVETGGFTKAADSLLISQPSLSIGIKRLERELGVVLFERGGRRAILTPAGQYFLGTAMEILETYQSTIENLREFHPQSTLRLGVLRTLRIDEFSAMITAFREKYPDTVIELRDGTVRDLHTWLEKGEVDVILTELASFENTDTSLAFFEQDYLLAVSCQHPFASREKVKLEDLNDQLFIGRNNCEVWGKAPQLFEAAGIEPRVVYLADREEWAISMVRSGLGVTIMPVWKGLSNIVYIPIAEMNLSRVIGLKWRLQQSSEVVTLFRTFAEKYSWRDV